MANFDTDVAVVGGGPGGLATAAAIQSASGGSTRVKVYESLSTFTLQGAAVGLQANAQHALEAIHPRLLALFLKHAMHLTQPAIRHDLKGNCLGENVERTKENVALYEKYGKRGCILGWHEIRQLLYEYLPSDVVEFDKQIVKYEDNGDGVTLHFDRDQPSVRARLLIGADGYFSRIRKQCLNDGPPLFAGSVMWRARIATPQWKSDDVGLLWSDPTLPIMGGPFAMLMPMGTLEGTRHKPWTWILGAPIAVVRKAGVEFDPNTRGVKAIQGDAQSGSALENALKIFEGMPADLISIVKQTDPSTVTQHGLYMRPMTETHPWAIPQPRKAAASGSTPPQPPATPPKETETPAPASPNPLSVDQSTDTAHEAEAAAAEASVQAATSTGALSATDKPEATTPGANTSSNAKTVTDAAASRHRAEEEDTTADGCNGTPAVADEGWGKGRVSLLGDAAHATIPNGQGLALALEDAVVLAWHLRRAGLTEDALRSYEREMLPRVKTMHIKAIDTAVYEDRERYIYKPTFKPLWTKQEAYEGSSCIQDFEPWEFS